MRSFVNHSIAGLLLAAYLLVVGTAGQTSTSFSNEATRLLQSITGNELPPFDQDAVEKQRWVLEFDYRDLKFQLVQTQEYSNGDEYQVQWLSRKPSRFMVKFMKGHSVRLEKMRNKVEQEAAALSSDEERKAVLQYYQRLKRALEHATWDSIGKNKARECSPTEDGEDQTCRVDYDPLDDAPEHRTQEFNHDICDFGTARDTLEDTSKEYGESQYQDMVFEYSPSKRDLCLTMSKHMHCCASWRPHYHEVLVHYPARFLQHDVKRVAFLGGGDNFIVEEILKYPSLELVLGLELDQGVVRTTFQKFGAQPHFDDERVHWYFGDAAKTILMLPTDYYYSFDLVVVDLANEIVDELMVTEELGITDAAMLLLKPDGVISRNEDWEFASTDPFTKYTVDLFYTDVPIICYHGVTLGSNTVDFVSATQKDHGVGTLFMKPVDEMSSPFELWYNYRKSSNHINRLCKMQGANDEELLTNDMRSRAGMLMIIEAEDAVMPLEPASVKASLTPALQKAGLTLTNVKMSAENESGYEIVFVLKEGYIAARVWPKLKYCGFDLLFWGSTDKQDATKTLLVAAIQSKSVSFYRILTGGMSGADLVFSGKGRVGPHISAPCVGERDKDRPRDGSVLPSEVDAVVSESASLIQADSTVLVLCGEQTRPCHSVEVLNKKEPRMDVIPIFACPDVREDAPQAMLKCEREVADALQALVDKVGGIVVDPETPRAMGQVLHMILSDVHFRRRLLSDEHVVLALSLNNPSAWHGALLDRFRTEFTVFDPAYLADVAIPQMVFLHVFSSVRNDFFHKLTDVVASIKRKIGAPVDIQRIQNGLNNYVADFEASATFTLDNYDDKPGLEQWYSQQPTSEQTLFQFTSHEGLSCGKINKRLQNALFKLSSGGDKSLFLETELYYEGDGCVIVGFWTNGSAVMTWDGRDYISVNFVTTNRFDDFETSGQFLELFGNKEKKPFILTGQDEMPRGVNRVMNFASDLASREDVIPLWAHEGK